MKFNVCILACLLLIAENALAAKKDFLKKVIENFTFGSITKSLVTCTFKNKPFMVFKTDKSINVFDVNGFHVKKMKISPDDCVNSVDVKEDFVVAGNKNGVIKIFDFETGCCIRSWQAHKECFPPCDIIVKTVNIDDELYIVSAGEDSKIRIWDMNGKCKKMFFLEDNTVVFNLFVIPQSNEGTLKIHAGLSQDKNAKFYWNYEEEEEVSEEENYYSKGNPILLLPEKHVVVCKGGTPVSPEISMVDYEEKNHLKHTIMEHTFWGGCNNKSGAICSIVPVPTTNYLYVFFERGMVNLFDWKNKKVIEEFSMGNGKEVISGGLLPVKEKLYAIVGFSDGTIKTKQIFPCDESKIVIKE